MVCPEDRGPLPAPQAVRKAKSYLGFTNFSRQGLIEQLIFEGFGNNDATYGVDNVSVAWKAQAAGKAQAYLDLSAFACQGLIDQLAFGGFSGAQAQYGANQVGLC